MPNPQQFDFSFIVQGITGKEAESILNAIKTIVEGYGAIMAGGMKIVDESEAVDDEE